MMLVQVEEQLILLYPLFEKHWH